MQLDVHLANGSRINKQDLAQHLVREHGYIYPLLKDLAKWSKEQLVQAHDHAHDKD